MVGACVAGITGVIVFVSGGDAEFNGTESLLDLECDEERRKLFDSEEAVEPLLFFSTGKGGETSSFAKISRDFEEKDMRLTISESQEEEREEYLRRGSKGVSKR